MERFTQSNLVLIDVPVKGSDAAWRRLQDSCVPGRPLTEWSLKTLREGLDGHVQTVLLEPHYICKDYRNLYSQFYSKKFLGRSSVCSRLHFFDKQGLTVRDVTEGSDEAQSAYIGFSILHPVHNSTPSRGLGRTVIDPLRCGNDPISFYCLGTTFRVNIQGAQFSVNGFPYMSQTGEATVCAHTALWSVCRYLSERYSEYGELYLHDLIRLTGDTEGRRVPYRGMFYTDYSTILSRFGCHPVIRRPRFFGKPDWHDDLEAYLDIYSYIESGFPVLASFRGHVAALVGHTSRNTLAFDFPDEHGFHNSYALLDQYVAVDDNFFPYQRLGDRADDDRRNYGRRFVDKGGHRSGLNPLPSKQDIYAAVIPLPEKAFMEPHLARGVSSRFFHSLRPLVDTAIATGGLSPTDPLIIRTFLTSSNAFKRRKKQCVEGKIGSGQDYLCQLPLRIDLPHFIWVSEISTLTAYNRGFLIGEVVIDASAGKWERGLICGRVGNTTLFQGTRRSAKDAPAIFRQYTHNLGER